MSSTLQAALVRLLAAIDHAENGDHHGGFGPGYENGHGEEVGSEIQAARAFAKQALANPSLSAHAPLTFDQWLALNQPAGSVGDMERGWNACAASLSIAPTAQQS